MILIGMLYYLLLKRGAKGLSLSVSVFFSVLVGFSPLFIHLDNESEVGEEQRKI